MDAGNTTDCLYVTNNTLLSCKDDDDGDDGDDWDPSQPVDAAVIGSGIGGLCCASILARYGLKVVVCESHDVAGGAAHSFMRKGFHFDSGPSFHAGLSTKPSINPLKQVGLSLCVLFLF